MGLLRTDRCSCALQGADGIDVSGGGTGANPWIIGIGGGLDADSVSVALLEVLCPAGTIRTTFHSLADTGWLPEARPSPTRRRCTRRCGRKVPAVLKSGTSLILPTDDEMVLRGNTTGIGAVSGSNLVTLATANLPAHAHPIDHDHPAGNTGTVSADHSHSVDIWSSYTDPNHYHRGLAGLQYVVAPGPVGLAFGSDFGIATHASTEYAEQAGGATDMSHRHAVNGSTGGISANHSHSFDPEKLLRLLGNAGSGTGLSVQEAGINVRVQVKAH